MGRDRFGLLRLLLLLWRNGWVAQLARTRWPKRSAILASRGEARVGSQQIAHDGALVDEKRVREGATCKPVP